MNNDGELLTGPELAAAIRADLVAERGVWGQSGPAGHGELAPMVERRQLSAIGPEVGVLLCPACNRQRDIGSVRRDARGRLWLAVHSWRWREGVIVRAPQSRNHADMWDVHDLAIARNVNAWCRNCGWRSVDLERARERCAKATPARPARLLLTIGTA